MSASVVSADFTARAGNRQLNVIAENEGYGRGAASRPKATDFPVDLVTSIRDWADAGLTGIHKDYRVPARLVAYLNEVIAADGTSPRGNVAHTVLGLLKLDTEGGN